MPRYAAKVDANQAEIVASLRGQGAFVSSTASMGRGFPDLFVVYRGMHFLLECKVGGGKLTPDQEVFWASYYSAGGKQLFVVRSASDALKAVLGGWLEAHRTDVGMSKPEMPVDTARDAKD